MAGKSRRKVSRKAAEDAVRTLLRWAGDDPDREGLLETPKRVVNAYRDWFSGYESDPSEYLRRTFEEVGGYDEMIVLRDISFESHCEHHMAPIIGRAHIGYLPTNKVVGISKLARVVEGCAALPGSGKNDSRDRQLHQRCAQATRRGCCDRRNTRVYDYPGHSQARCIDGDQPHDRNVP
jgi:hypothetical protein